MITMFNSAPIYVGTDVTEYNRICNILSDNKIRYKTHTTSTDGSAEVRRFRGHGVTLSVDIEEEEGSPVEKVNKRLYAT